MSARNDPAHRRRVRIFVGAHLAAVVGAYGIALAVGGGLAPPPFPPDIRTVPAQPAVVAAMPAPPPTRVQGPSTSAGPPVIERVDLLPPWLDDPQGRVRWRQD